MSAAASNTALAVRNILLATDFSPCSQRALLHAVAAARRFGSTLHLLHVVTPTMFSLVPPEGYLNAVEAAKHAANRARADAEVILRNVLCHTHCEGLKSHIWVQIGEVGETLRTLIGREHIDLVVIGTRGRTGLHKMVLGSVAEEIFRQTSCPVLTVGPQSWQSDPETVRLKQILFPTNLTENSARALPLALGMAAEFDAQLTMLNVIETVDPNPSCDRLIADSQERMRKMVSAAGLPPPKADFQVKFGDIVDQVLNTAACLKADLIIAGLNPPDTHINSLPWMRAYKVVCTVGCPVLTVRGRNWK